MRKLFAAAALLSLLSTPALADPPEDRGRLCVSGGANANSPGHWFQELKEHPQLEGMNPAELAEKENTTSGWAGYGQTPNVGAFIDFFCEGGREHDG